jgi:putative tryptophan/tyrosine transport system substrate-binding protein
VNSRRKLIMALGAGALTVPFASLSQQLPARMNRIGFLGFGSSTTTLARTKAFLQGLRDLGYIEGKNIVIEYRWADGKVEILPDLAAQLVDLKSDVIFAQGPQATLAAKKASTTIPIVFVGIGDPVSRGMVASLARPGGNITGLSNLAPTLSSKRLELLKESAPRILSVAVFWNGTSPGNREVLKDSEVAARALKLTLHPIEVRKAEDFDAAFQAVTKARADALMPLPDPFTNAHLTRVIEFAAKNRLPAIYAGSEFADAGGLMSYAPNIADQYRRAATYVDKILKGAKPANLPVEQPTRFELVVNMRTAKALSIAIPRALLASADRVIE